MGQNILRSPAQPSFHVTTNITGFIVLVHQPSCLVHDIFTGSGRVFFDKKWCRIRENTKGQLLGCGLANLWTARSFPKWVIVRRQMLF